MTCDANVTTALQRVLLARDDGDTQWEVIGGVKTLGYNFDNTAADTTSSSTAGDIQESQWVGFSQVTLDVSGVADKQTGTDPETGLNLVGAGRLASLATTGQRCGKFRLFNVETSGYIEGFFVITAYGNTGDTPGLVNFNSTLQSKTGVTISGSV